jgi:cytochrome b subunit of formate dehydrogenase
MCGECHKEQLKGYRDTFHGKAMALGRAEVAACYDCHGHHDIVDTSDTASHINGDNRLKTCQKCHPAANANFAQYIVHADHSDKERYPQLYYVFWFMTLLLVGTFAFFALHTILWLFRSTALYTGDSRQWREEKIQARADTEEFVRFRPLDRFLHGLVIVSFLLLVITGMPLKFFYTDWAQAILAVMGGQAVAAVLHRLGAIVTIFYMTLHVISVLYRFLAGRRRFRNPDTGRLDPKQIMKIIFGPDSPMPRVQDLKDMIAHNKWFFGKGPKPQFDRWTYWEKFDYMAVFWGVTIIGTSGLIMWFPEYFTILLPGWIINVALIIHSDEALLAAGFIFTFHFFNVHFRPDKFPMDPVMFSGRISKSELLNERRRLYDRWVAEGELDKHRVGDLWASWSRIALPAGFIAFMIGLALAVLIFYAMLSRLAGE